MSLKLIDKYINTWVCVHPLIIFITITISFFSKKQ